MTSDLLSAEASLAGKTCVITGGTRGIGEATATLFADCGANVLITSRDEKRGKRAEANSERIQFKRADLGSRSDTLKLLEWLDSKCEKVDVMINNAGADSRYRVTDVPTEEWDRTVEINLTAPFLLSRWAARKMIEKKTKGKIIIVGGIQAYSPLESSFAHVTTKGGIISMVRSLAVDLGSHGILTTAVIPGSVSGVFVDEKPSESLDERSATLVRRMGRPIEVARLLAFLASDHNSFMTGNVIIVDGGRVISRRPDPDEIRLENLQEETQVSASTGLRH